MNSVQAKIPNYTRPEDNALCSFTSLLSTSQTFGMEEPVHPTPEPTLANFLSPQVVFDSSNPYCNHICSFPCLSLKNKLTEDMCSQKKMTRQETAAFNLAFPVFHDRNNVEDAPVTLLNNFSKSFMSLTESRLRTSIMALSGSTSEIVHSQEGTTLMNLLSGSGGSSPVTLTTIVTSFRTLQATENSDDGALYLPLVFEATVDVMVLGALVTCTVSAPGTIIGTFNQEDGLLERVEILFDSIALLKAMMKQARSIVRKAIARAAGMAHKLISQVLSILSTENKEESLNGLTGAFAEKHDLLTFHDDAFNQIPTSTQEKELYVPEVTSSDQQITESKTSVYNSQIDSDINQYMQFLSGEIDTAETLSKPCRKISQTPKYNAQIESDVDHYLQYLSGASIETNQTSSLKLSSSFSQTPKYNSQIDSDVMQYLQFLSGGLDSDENSLKRNFSFTQDTHKYEMKRRKVSFCTNC